MPQFQNANAMITGLTETGNGTATADVAALAGGTMTIDNGARFLYQLPPRGMGLARS